MGTNCFSDLTLFILASNEQVVLQQTLDTILQTCDDQDISRIIIALKSKRCESYRFLQNHIFPDKKYVKVSSYIQKQPGIVQCMSELPELVKSSHFLIMSADNEMSPLVVKSLISNARKYPDTIICAAKWKKESVIHGKMDLHLYGSYWLNRLCARILHCKACDPCSIFRVYPVSLFESLPSGDSSVFLYEYTLKPLACGMRYLEIPTEYNKRAENQSNFNFLNYISYTYQYLCFAVKYRKMFRRVKVM